MGQKLKIEIEVSKEAYELASGIKDFVIATKIALADGWQPGQDLTAIMGAAMGNLVPAMIGVEKIGDEMKDLDAFTNAMLIPIKEIAFEFVKKPKEEIETA